MKTLLEKARVKASYYDLVDEENQILAFMSRSLGYEICSCDLCLARFEKYLKDLRNVRSRIDEWFPGKVVRKCKRK